MTKETLSFTKLSDAYFSVKSTGSSVMVMSIYTLNFHGMPSSIKTPD